MVKKLLIFICIYIPAASFGQSRQLIDSIDKVIGPEYILDKDTSPSYHSYTSFWESDLTGDGKKEIIVVAGNVDNTEGEHNKIFILTRKDNWLKVIDTSAAYEVDGRGPQVEVDGKQLTVIHAVHRASSSLRYRFNNKLNKYLLAKCFYKEVDPDKDMEGAFFDYSSEYDFRSQILTSNTDTRSYGDGKLIKKGKEKKIYKKLHDDTSLRLSGMKDPIDYEFYY